MRIFFSRTAFSTFPAPHVLYGSAAAFLSWALFEPFFQEGGSVGRVGLANVFMFPASIGAVSAALCAVHGSSWEHRSGKLSAAVAGWAVAFASAFLVFVPVQILFDYFLDFAKAWMALQPGSFFSVMVGRSFAWGLPAAAAGLGVYVGTQSPRLMVAATVGGLLGGLMAGLLFDPLQVVYGTSAGSYQWVSRAVGFVTVGGMVSLCTGVADDWSG